MEPNIRPILNFESGEKGGYRLKNHIKIKSGDRQFFFKILDVKKRQEKDPENPYWYESNGEIFFWGASEILKKHNDLIHKRMGLWCNLKGYQQFLADENGDFEDLEQTGLLWVKTIGKDDNKYNNEYRFEELDKVRCYKTTRFLRDHDYQFSPELNDYLFLRCGIKFDLDLMDVEVVMFNDMKGQIYPTPSTGA